MSRNVTIAITFLNHNLHNTRFCTTVSLVSAAVCALGGVVIRDPICVVTNTLPWGLPYTNPCYAKADGFDGSKESGSWYYKGPCKTECDARCNNLVGARGDGVGAVSRAASIVIRTRCEKQLLVPDVFL